MSRCSLGQISHAVSVVSRYMTNLRVNHWRVVKWIMRYLRGTMEYGMVYGGLNGGGNVLVGYVYSDFTRDLDKRRLQTNYLFTLGGCTVS